MPDGVKDIRSAVPVLDAGRMGDGKQQEAQRVGHDVTLAPLDLLTGIEARSSPAFSCLDALAVDHARRRACLPALQFPCDHHQQMVDALPQRLVCVREVAPVGYATSMTTPSAVVPLLG